MSAKLLLHYLGQVTATQGRTCPESQCQECTISQIETSSPPFGEKFAIGCGAHTCWSKVMGFDIKMLRSLFQMRSAVCSCWITCCNKTLAIAQRLPNDDSCVAHKRLSHSPPRWISQSSHSHCLLLQPHHAHLLAPTWQWQPQSQQHGSKCKLWFIKTKWRMHVVKQTRTGCHAFLFQCYCFWNALSIPQSFFLSQSWMHSRNKVVPLAATKRFKTISVPQIGDTLGHVATGLPSCFAKCNVLEETLTWTRREVNKENNKETTKETTKETKITVVQGGELLPALQLRCLHRDGLSGHANCCGDGTRAMCKCWTELTLKHFCVIMMKKFHRNPGHAREKKEESWTASDGVHLRGRVNRLSRRWSVAANELVMAKGSWRIVSVCPPATKCLKLFLSSLVPSTRCLTMFGTGEHLEVHWPKTLAFLVAWLNKPIGHLVMNQHQLVWQCVDKDCLVVGVIKWEDTKPLRKSLAFHSCPLHLVAATFAWPLTHCLMHVHLIWIKQTGVWKQPSSFSACGWTP